ncbi:hypothetical protein EON65_36065 [archaeon]|nr:MAG: hypothetical protein EON65_36065 [archaeon]
MVATVEASGGGLEAAQGEAGVGEENAQDAGEVEAAKEKVAPNAGEGAADSHAASIPVYLQGAGSTEDADLGMEVNDEASSNAHNSNGGIGEEVDQVDEGGSAPVNELL